MLRYASHLGFRAPDLPLFPHASGGLDPCAHIALAHRLGFAGMLYPWALSRPREEVSAVTEALTEHGLECGCVVYGSRELLGTPLWGEPGEAARETILGHVGRASVQAARLGSRTLAVLAAASPDRPLAAQRPIMAGHLRAAADRAAQEGVDIGIEPMIVLPDMLLKNCAETLEVIRDADHKAARIIFDTSHVEMMDGDVVGWFEQLYDHVCILQLADHPGRVEPGAGTIDFPGLLATAMRRRFEGLVELEHFWSRPGLEGERTGLIQCRAIDAMAAAQVQWEQAMRVDPVGA